MLGLAFDGGDAHIAAAMTATLHAIGARRNASLDPMIQLVAADLNHVNAVILERMQSEIALIPELAGHLLIWNNLDGDGRGNTFSLHQGMPVTAGVKYIITKWNRERPWIALTEDGEAAPDTYDS